ncbi:MAG: hypothetical protein JZU70_05730 [Chlorobium sp.]|jgi:hypothetical protein|nr:hypothetical protein [Chlorobium sp.]
MKCLGVSVFLWWRGALVVGVRYIKIEGANMETKYLLLFHSWNSGCYSHIRKHATRIVIASNDVLQKKIDEATYEVNRDEQFGVFDEAFVLQQVLPL